ncbi:MAG: hypothetical protein LBB88_06100 [Planctomycetaceae bacterium]|nr:hypothetical protein [Planctomycetaceae bacterium]
MSIFKRIFGEHKDLCRSLLNNVLPLPSATRPFGERLRTYGRLPEIWG